MSTEIWVMIACTITITVIECLLISDKIHFKKKEADEWQEGK